MHTSSHSLMTLGLCPFHQSYKCFFLICLWKSLHFLTLINQQAQPLHLCLAWVVGVFTSFNLSSFNSTSSWNAKSGSEPLPLADFALDNATNRVPGFFASNSRVSNIIPESLTDAYSQLVSTIKSYFFSSTILWFHK